jgi:hypothetical protein
MICLMLSQAFGCPVELVGNKLCCGSAVVQFNQPARRITRPWLPA